MGATQESGGTRLVWDWPVRLTHWLLLLAVTGSYVTHRLGSEEFRYHRWSGYTTLVLVTVRLAWGFVGTRHARFAAFVRGPAAVWRYLADLVRNRAPRYAGHNPAGGWMVLVLLGLLGAQAVTGLFANDDIMNTGPLFGYVSGVTSDRLTGWHHRLFDGLLIAIGFHVIAIGTYLRVKKINLVMPMLRGGKPASELAPGEEIPTSRLWLWLVLVATASLLLAWIVKSAPQASLFVF